MTRVLFLNYEYPPLGGGAANATFYLLREFSKIPDLEIDLVTSSVNEERTEKIADNVTIHYLNIHKRGNLHFQSMKDLLVYSWKAYWYSKKLLKLKKYDLCHAFFGIPCGYLAMKLGLPYIVSLRGSDIPFYNSRFYFLDKFLFHFISRSVWKNSHSVVALSHDSVNLARQTSKVQKISVIYNGINIQEFHPNPEILGRENTINILFEGRLIERKGLGYLLEAVSQLVPEYPNIKLLVVSDGPLREKYESYVREHKLSKHVDFLGRLEHDKMAGVYQCSHIFVLPSLNEALSNATQEALASGLPIITTKTGAAELIEEGRNGYAIEKASSQAIREKIKILLDDPVLRNSMARRSWELAEKMGWENVAEKYAKLYRLIGQPRVK